MRERPIPPRDLEVRPRIAARMTSPELLETSLDRITLEMTSTLDLGAVLESIARGLVEDFGVALSRVWLAEPGDGVLHLRASSGLSPATTRTRRTCCG